MKQKVPYLGQHIRARKYSNHVFLSALQQPVCYRQFFLDAGYRDVKISLAEGRIPCAVAVMAKEDL